MQEMKCLLLLCAVLLFGNISCAILQGIIQVKSPAFLAFHKTNSSQTLTVQVFQLSLGHDNRPILPTVDYLYKTKPISSISQSISLPQQTTIPFQISSLSKNTYYSLFAYISASPQDSQFYYGMVGWYTNATNCEWMSPIYIQQENTVLKEGTIIIEGKTPFFANPKRPTKHAYGQLKLIKNTPILQLKSNNPRNRGLAHGFLIAEQIVEFFRFFLLQYYIQPRSCNTYNELVVPQFSDRNQMFYSNDFWEEANGVLEGMKQANINLYIPELARNFSLVDLIAINGYTELPHFLQTPTKTPACTQFAMWGASTSQSSLQGGIMGARNMDGELDIRKTTVSHFLLFAVDPSSKTSQRFVSFMFPGFIGTLSGINERGFYSMVNFGQSHPNIQYKNVTILAEVVRQLLMQTDGINTDAKQVATFLKEQFVSQTGGICGYSCVIFMIKNYYPRGLSQKEDPSPAFVYEGDFMGGEMRLAGQAEPVEIQSGILASNHYQLYGVDPVVGSSYNFGHSVYYSSLWRYTAPSQYMRATATQNTHDYNSMLRLMQTSCHGSTEHSIMYYPQQGKVMFYVFVANEKSNTSWDAPYEKPTQFVFDECFA